MKFSLISYFFLAALGLFAIIFNASRSTKSPDPTPSEIKTFAAKEAVTLRTLAKSFRMEGKRDSALLYEGQAKGLETAVGYINLKP